MSGRITLAEMIGVGSLGVVIHLHDALIRGAGKRRVEHRHLCPPIAGAPAVAIRAPRVDLSVKHPARQRLHHPLKTTCPKPRAGPPENQVLTLSIIPFRQVSQRFPRPIHYFLWPAVRGDGN